MCMRTHTYLLNTSLISGSEKIGFGGFSFSHSRNSISSLYGALEMRCTREGSGGMEGGPRNPLTVQPLNLPPAPAEVGSILFSRPGICEQLTGMAWPTKESQRRLSEARRLSRPEANSPYSKKKGGCYWLGPSSVPVVLSTGNPAPQQFNEPALSSLFYG